MAKGVFLVNPELNKTDVAVSASSELGARAGSLVPGDGNSGLLAVNADGDPGDSLAHSFEIAGSQVRPSYYPLAAGGSRYFTDPTTFGDLATVAVGAGSRHCIVAGDDRLWMIVADGASLILKVYVGDGAAWSITQSFTGLTNVDGGVAACSIKTNLYIALANQTDAVIELYRYSTASNTIGFESEAFVTYDAASLGTINAISMATNGATFVLLASVSGGTKGTDVVPFFGWLGTMEQADSTINDTFSATWSTSNDVRCGDVKYIPAYGYVGAFRSGTGSPADLRVAVSPNGDGWTEFTNIVGAVAQPTVSAGWSTITKCAIVGEYRRFMIFRQGGTNLVAHLFNGGKTWDAEADCDGGNAVASGSDLSAANWRGRYHFAWFTTTTSVIARKCNALTLTNTGKIRDLIIGVPMFLAGIEDDTKTRLAFVATGTIVAGDKFEIGIPEFDYRAIHVLDDLLQRVWRGTDGADQTITLNAGSGLGFTVDSIALFGTNFPACTIKLNTTSTFTSPAYSQTLSAVIQSASVVSASGNRLLFADDTFEDRAFAPGARKFWVKAGSTIRRILNSTHNALILDGSASGMSGTADIFGNSFGYLLSSPVGPYQYAQIAIPSTATAEGYYQMTRAICGLMFAPPVDYRIEWLRRISQQMGRVELKNGARYNTRLSALQRPAWTLTYRHYEAWVRRIERFFGQAQGGVQMVAFWPDPSALVGDQPEVYPMFFGEDSPEHKNIPPDAAEVSVVIEGQL